MSGSITPASVACIRLWKYCPEAQKLNGTHILVVMSKMQVILFKFNAVTVDIIKQKMTQKEARALIKSKT